MGRGARAPDLTPEPFQGGTVAPPAGDRLLHMIGNAHIDAVWLWQWPEGYQEVRATFRSAIDRMAEYPEFVFTCDSVLYLDWVKESDPELFAAIRERIAEGRWVVVGGWWVEPDCNLPGGESFARHGLYSQRWLHEEFGITATVGCNVDSFGHNASIPQLLRGAGMDSYLFLRPGPHERTLPGPYFWWESPDGSRVLAYRIPHEYGSAPGDLGYQVDKALAQLPPEPRELMVFYGVGNHGGGPTKANIESIRKLDAVDGLPRMRCASPREFVDGVLARDLDGSEDVPVHAGELQHHAVGCYSAHSGVKRWNRRAENLLVRAEKWAAIAAGVAGVEYPLAAFTEAWKLVLFNQFHDTLAGASIAAAYDDSRDQYGHASSIAATAFNRAVQAVSRRIDIPAELETTPLVVFNPHPWPVRADVEFEFGGFPQAGASVLDDAGAPVPVQRTRSQATVLGWRRRLVVAADLPPLGYRTYRIRPAAPQDATVDAARTVLENDHLAVEVDPATGWLRRLHDKANDAELAAPGGHAVVLADASDTWGHRVRAYDDVVGAFTPESVRLVEHGPVRAVLRVRSRYGQSRLTEEFVLGADARHVEVRVRLDWREPLHLLKLRVPTALSEVTATHEIPYGSIVRPADGSEEAAQTWVDVTGVLPDGRTAGLAVVNDGKHAHDVRGADVGITAARSPVLAWHEPKELDDDEEYDYLDQGLQEFTYLLVPHAGDRSGAGVARRAAELNQQPFPLLESYHRGELPQQASFGAVECESVVLTVLKGAEDGEGALVVRAYETAGRATEATLMLLGHTWTASFGPHEIKTFRLQKGAVEETNLLEWPLRGSGKPHS